MPAILAHGDVDIRNGSICAIYPPRTRSSLAWSRYLSSPVFFALYWLGTGFPPLPVCLFRTDFIVFILSSLPRFPCAVRAVRFVRELSLPVADNKVQYVTVAQTLPSLFEEGLQIGYGGFGCRRLGALAIGRRG